MEKKNLINRGLKIIGNVVMVIAIVFIVKNLISSDIDYRVVFQKDNLLVFLCLTIAYALSVIFTSVPWRNMVYLISGEKIKFIEVAMVSTKANVMKYIPGNVFQYIGRNELAVKKGMKHTDVAMATLLDVIVNLGSVFLITLIFSFDTIIFWLKEYVSEQYFVVIAAAAVIMVLLVLVLVYKNKEKYTDILKRIFCPRGIAAIVMNVIVYAVLSIYTTVIYMIVLYVVSENGYGMEHFLMIAGAVLASWILGFITPGAPGGIGIRETILIMLMGSILSGEAILMGVVVNRVISIAGDLLALIMMQFVGKVRGRRNE